MAGRKKQSTEPVTILPRVATCHLVGMEKMTWGRPHQSVKEADESPEAFDARCWKERIHVDAEGFVVIPAEILPKSLVYSAKWLSEKLKGAKTFTARFKAGVRAMKAARVEPDLHLDKVTCEKHFVPAQPDREGGPRVWRHFPVVPMPWEVKVQVMVVDGLITEDVFERHVKAAGMFDGFGTHRPGSPKKSGPNGTYGVADITWENLEL